FTESGMDQCEARISDGCAGGDRCRIPVERNQPAGRPEPFENRATVAAATESAIDIDAIRPYRQRIDRLGQQHADMRAWLFLAHKEKSSKPGGGSVDDSASKAASCWRFQPASLQI